MKRISSASNWGGDTHVPHGDLEAARRVGEMTRDAGLEVAAYGSYYRAGHDDELAFERVLPCAAVLGAPLIRVWAGKQSSADADEDYRDRVVNDLRRICEMAKNIDIALEFHENTLTDTAASARRLLENIDCPNIRTLWQPPVNATREECLADLQTIKLWLANLHVFQWRGNERRPLEEGENDWRDYLAAANNEETRYALLEFVADDEPENFRRDAKALCRWTNE